MASNPCSSHINCKLHGDNVANCGPYPQIYADFTITFTRQSSPPSQVNWAITGMDRNTCFPNPNGAYGQNWYGFVFNAYVSVNGSDEDLLSSSSSLSPLIAKVASPYQDLNWWKSTYTTLYTPSGTLTSTYNTTTISLYVENKHDCTYNSKYCYRLGNTGTYMRIATFTVDIPDSDYTVSYDTIGGVPAIASQKKSSGSALTLTNIVPSKQYTVAYYNNTESSYPTDIVKLGMTFENWKCSADNQLYAPGSSYSINQNCVMTAQWTATFVAIDMPDKYYTLTYDYNGGTGSPASVQVARGSKCYVEHIGGTSHYVCEPGEEYTTPVNPDSPLELYPSYGSAAYPVSSMPVPIKACNKFLGWYKDPQLTQKITSVLIMDGDTTIYAKWEPSTIHYFGPDWTTSTDFTWRYVDGAWHKIGHMYRYDASQGKWIDLIPTPQPAIVFKAGEGLTPYYDEGTINLYNGNISFWHVQQDYILKPAGFMDKNNAMITFGGECERGNYRYLCCEGEVWDGSDGPYNSCSISIRAKRKGKGDSADNRPAPELMAYLVNYADRSNAAGTSPWYNVGRTTIRIDLSKFIAETFYISIHGCDCQAKIYNIWFE